MDTLEGLYLEWEISSSGSCLPFDHRLVTVHSVWSHTEEVGHGIQRYACGHGRINKGLSVM